MSLARHASHRIAHTHLPSTSSRLWIGDEYLNTLLHQFTISKPCVRHGSSVPGPLEARKRQAKRRMMNLAAVGGEGSMDSGAFLGMGKSFSERDLKWEPPKQPAHDSKAPASRLPSWLEDFDASASKDAPLPRSEPDGTSSVTESGAVAGKVGSEKPSLESELQESNTIEEIRRAAFHHNAAVASNKAHSALAFGRLLDSDSSMPVILEFLEDKKLNSPAARNLATLMARGILEKTHEEIESLRAWIEQRIAPGILSEFEIQSLLHGLSLSLRQKPPPPRARWRNWSICKSIWQGIQASDTNGIPKLGPDTIRQLLEAASRSPNLDEGRGVGMKILKMRKDKLGNLLPNISRFALQLARTPLSRLPDGSIGPQEDWSFSWFYPLLALVPQEDASAIMVNLSWKLTRRIMNRERNGDLMAQEWFSVLTPEVFQAARKDPKWAEKWWLIDRDLASLTHPDSHQTIASYLQPFDDKERYLFLLRSWVPPRWPRGDKIKIYVFSEASADTASWKEFIRRIELEPYFPGIDPDTMLLDIVQRLHKTYLEVLRTILPDLLHLLRHLGQPSAILRIAHYLKDQNVHVDYSTWATEVTAHLPHALPLAYSLFKVDSRLRFEDCPGLAEALIASASLATAPIFLLLQRQRRTIGSVPLPQTTNSRHLLAITPERVALLHSMALAFAHAGHLSPRQAYRGVSRCAQYFRERPDLLRPEMARALATAGVLRYLERGLWVSTVRFEYVLGMVRGLEGDAVAAELDRVVGEWGRENAEKAGGSTLPPERRDGGSRRSIPPQLPLALTRGPAEGSSSAVAAAVTAVAAAAVVIIIAIVAVAAAVAAAVAVTAVSAAVSSAATVAAVTAAVPVAVAIAVADAVPANSQRSFAASLPPQPKTCEKVREEANRWERKIWRMEKEIRRMNRWGSRMGWDRIGWDRVILV